jgi:uncharacterized membrane protein
MELLFFIGIGIVTRILPHPANVTAVGAVALFTGATFGRRKAMLITLITMFISDMVIGYHSLMWATYGSMILAVLVGHWIGATKKMNRIVGGTFCSSLIFYIITNFAVWAMTPLYTKTIDGLITCYVMALPFFRNSLLGDMTFAILFFSCYVCMQSLQKYRLFKNNHLRI